MQLDIRMPIGLLFTLLGAIILVLGIATQGNAMYSHSLGININIYSGVGLLIFGIIMLVFAVRAQNKMKQAAKQ
jgi:hypothetical protein